MCLFICKQQPLWEASYHVGHSGFHQLTDVWHLWKAWALSWSPTLNTAHGIKGTIFGTLVQTLAPDISLSTQSSPLPCESSDVPTTEPAFLILPKNPGESEESNLPALPIPKKKTRLLTVPLKLNIQAESSRVELDTENGIYSTAEKFVIQTNHIFLICVRYMSIYESQATSWSSC